jgi:DNA-binding NarL/FixJ family response regulator
VEAILEKLTLRVLIVDDYEQFRRFIATKLQTNPQLRIVKEACDGADAVQQAQELQPDLILLDIGLPTLNGIEAARRIRKVSPASKILFVSENRSADIAEETLSTGACGYVIKSDAERELLPAIEAILAGKRFVSACLAGHFLVATTLSATQTILS